MRKHGTSLYCFIRGAERSRYFQHHDRARIPKPLVLAAFFGYFLSLVTESTPPEAFVGTRSAGKESLSHGFAVTAPFRQGGQATPQSRRSRDSLPTVVPADSRPLSWPPIGALPRNRLASSATGSASAISPCAEEPLGMRIATASVRTGFAMTGFARGAVQDRAAG